MVFVLAAISTSLRVVVRLIRVVWDFVVGGYCEARTNRRDFICVNPLHRKELASRALYLYVAVICNPPHITLPGGTRMLT